MIDDLFVIDAHSHIYPPQKQSWGIDGQTPEMWLERMEKNGIDMAVIMSQCSVLPEVQRERNHYTAEAAKRYPDKFIALAPVSPRWGQIALDEMQTCFDEGMKGLKLVAQSHGYYSVDSAETYKLVEKAAELGWPVMIHTDINSIVCSPFVCLRLARRYPEVRFIFSHFGIDPDVTSQIAVYVKELDNVWLDSSASPNEPQFVYKTTADLLPGRLMFGTDAPGLSPEVELYKVKIAEELFGLTTEQKAEILGKTASRLFRA